MKTDVEIMKWESFLTSQKSPYTNSTIIDNKNTVNDSGVHFLQYVSLCLQPVNIVCVF